MMDPRMTIHLSSTHDSSLARDLDTAVLPQQGRIRTDDDVGSVSTVCSDMESDFVDVAGNARRWLP